MTSSEARELSKLVRLAKNHCVRGGFAKNLGTGEVVGLACKSPGCPDCAPILATMISDAFTACHPGWPRVMLTLTYRDGQVPPGYAAMVAARAERHDFSGRFRRLEDARASVNADLRSDWSGATDSFLRRLKQALPAVKDSFWVKAFELGETNDRPHIHVVFDLRPTVSVAVFTEVCERLWGPTADRHDAWGKPRTWAASSTVGNRGRITVSLQRKSLVSYLCGYLSAFSKKGIGYISKNRNLCAAIREEKAEWKSEKGIPLLSIDKWQYLRDIEGIASRQRVYSRELRVAGRHLDLREVQRCVLNLHNLQIPGKPRPVPLDASSWS